MPKRSGIHALCTETGSNSVDILKRNVTYSASDLKPNIEDNVDSQPAYIPYSVSIYVYVRSTLAEIGRAHV